MTQPRARSDSRPSADPGERPFEVALEQAELFRALAPESWRASDRICASGAFYRQRVLFREGEPAASLWVVRRGAVRIYHVVGGWSRRPRSSRSGRARSSARSPRSSGERYPVSAEALEEGFAWCLPRDVLQRMLDEDPRVGVEMLRIVASRLRSAHSQLHSFAHDRAPARLARALLQHAARRRGVASRGASSPKPRAPPSRPRSACCGASSARARCAARSACHESRSRLDRARRG